MWILTAIGPVHGLNRFTLALEQRKSYTVGRDKTCDIRFDSRYVKPVQGSVIVGDWDPNSPDGVPELEWRSEPNKKGVHPAFKTITPRADELFGSTNKDEYDLNQVAEGTPSHPLHRHPGGQGIELGEECWFSTRWVPLSLCYERMSRDEDERVPDILRRYSIPHSPTFEESSLPSVVISPVLRGSAQCNYAVCYGIRIVLPSFLRDIVARLEACWKKGAEEGDSFVLPDPADPAYQPELDANLPSARNALRAWSPDPSRRSLFKGWTLLGLRTRTTPAEKRFLLALGADFTDIDVTTDPIKSSSDFQNRISDWVKRADQNGERNHGIVVYFARVKEELGRAGTDFETVVAARCRRLGFTVLSGSVCWGAVKAGSVQAYIQQVTAANRVPESTNATSDNSVSEQAGGSSRQSASQIPVVPSTFPEESDGGLFAPPSAQTRQSTPETAPPSTGVRKPLRKRTAKKIDLFADDLDVVPESIDMPDSEPSQAPPPSQIPSVVHDSLETQPTETQTINANGKRLRRRAGPETQKSLFDFGFDDAFDRERKKEEEAAEIRELYHQTKAKSLAATASVGSMPPPSKRPRLASESREAPVDVVMEEDEEVEDPIQSMLRKAREAREQTATSKKESRQPKTVQLVEEEEEEEEEEEPRARASTQVTKDEAFLQAIGKATRTKIELDELDKEFNNLRIPKPATKSRGKAAEVPPTGPYDHPDWNLVDQFDDDLRGNFIQIVKKDLFRKDQGVKEAPRVDDGRPNFKKFKKKNIVRREPLRLALAGPNLNDAEMGEPCWVDAPQSKGPDDEMPLLPRSSKRVMIRDESPEESAPPPTRRRGQTQTQTQTLTRPRSTRASSVASDVSSTPSTRSTSTATRRKPKPAARGKKTMEPMVVEDSEDEVTDLIGRTVPASASAMSATATGRRASRVAGTFDESKTARAMPSSARRRLLVDDDDDDDDTTVKNLQKKRRLG